MHVRIWLMTLIAMSSLAPFAAGQGRVIGDLSRDLQHTMQARKLLADDSDLAAWNVGVIVNDRVAVLWGPAPSAEVAFRAELCLKAMAELVEVRNELIVIEPLEPALLPRKLDVRPRQAPELLAPRMPDESRWKAPPAAVLTGKPKDALPQMTTSSKKPAEIIQSADADQALTATIRVFLESKTSYSVVQFSVQDRRVYLKAANRDSDALHEAARGISRLPNVEGVVLSEK